MADKTNTENTDAKAPLALEAVDQAPLLKSSTSFVVSANADSGQPLRACSTAPVADPFESKCEPGLTPGSIQIVDAAMPCAVEVIPSPKRFALGMIWEMLKLFLVPVLILSAFVAGIALLGLAQRFDWIESASTGSESSAVGKTSEETNESWICPMMCVPPTNQPGRCPVCAMELVPASKSSSSGPSTTIEIDPRSRRVAGIQTTVAKLELMSRQINSVGEIKYDESRQKTLSAYIDGRIEDLKADFTGVEVKRGESLGLLYSPDLYSAQIEYLKTLEFNENNSSSNPRVRNTNQRLLKSSRQKLVELGLTEQQIRKLETGRVASRVLDLFAPISGTVIEKKATIGQYIKEGEPIYRLADLSKVWLVLELFPEDARAVQLGQPVKATTQSLGSESFDGVVEFIEPTVDAKTRTVGVRVAVNNQDGSLKPGEFATASLTIPVSAKKGSPTESVVIPRNSLLSIGKTSLAYVEIKPGEFELRKVKTGPSVNGMVAVFEGIEPGDHVVSKSTFLLDAQMQLQGNPSLIDPDKAVVSVSNNSELTDAEKEEIQKALAPLSDADRKLAEAQIICPVTEVRLGSLGMGTPLKMEVEGRTVFICCEGCRDGMTGDPEKYFKILDDFASGKPKPQLENDTNQVSPTTSVELPQLDLPQMDLPQMDLPEMDLPQMDLPQMEPPNQ